MVSHSTAYIMPPYNSSDLLKTGRICIGGKPTPRLLPTITLPGCLHNAVSVLAPCGMVCYKHPLSNSIIKRPVAQQKPTTSFMLIRELRMMRRPHGAVKKNNGYTRIAIKKAPKSRLVGALGITSVSKYQSAQAVKRLLTHRGLVPVRKRCPHCGVDILFGEVTMKGGVEIMDTDALNVHAMREHQPPSWTPNLYFVQT